MQFIVAAPPYSHQSGGIIVLHELCTTLNQIGYNCSIALITGGSQDQQNFSFGYSASSQFYDPNGKYFDFFTNRNSKEIDEYVKNCFVIYPDIIKGNPLGSKFYSTYILGFPKFEIYSDFTITHSKIYYRDYDLVLFNPCLSKYMNSDTTRHWKDRNLDLTYIGKGYNFADCFVKKNSVLIERNWPKEKEQLAILLKNCRYFFTWDLVSATNLDAILCGAIPVFMQETQIKRYELINSELGTIPWIDKDIAIKGLLPDNIDEIDDQVKRIKIRANEMKSEWIDNVKSLAEMITVKFYG